ncbi:MAG: DNA repair protein RecO [Lachnospiraceae bacterium]|nr:DNA repair protein RecO [Lachnospiraceae bacterium]
MVEQVTLRGVVLSAMPISEYDKRLVILTKERGKITAFARGARKATSQFLAASQPMTFGEYTVYQGRNAYTITSVKVTKYFAQNITDIEQMPYGMYFLEVSDYFGREGMEASDSINLIYLAIKALLNPDIPDRLARAIYELKTMVIHGEYPNFFTCSHCGTKEQIYYFDKNKYRVLCRNCGGQVSANNIHISESAIYSLQFVVATPISKLFTFTVKEEVLDEICEVVTHCFTKLVDREFKSLEFLV